MLSSAASDMHAAIGKSYHVFALVPKVVVEICGHILDIVDAAP